jgi:hypothetical protein
MSNPNSTPNSSSTSTSKSTPTSKEFDPRAPFATELTTCDEWSSSIVAIKKGFKRANFWARLAAWLLRLAMLNELEASRLATRFGDNGKILSPTRQSQVDFWDGWIRSLFKEVYYSQSTSQSTNQSPKKEMENDGHKKA